MSRLDRILAGRTISFGALGLLALWGLFSGPLRGYADGITGGLFSVIVVLLIAYAFFRLMVWLAGPHVLPVDLHDRHEKRAARRVLARFAAGRPTLMAVVREGQVRPGPDGKARSKLSGAGVIDVDSTTVITLLTDTGPSRIKGQGLVFTKVGEKLGAIVDLRVQLRSGEFEFATRDGIMIKVRIAIRFQIDQVNSVQVQSVDRAVRWPRPFTWTPRTIWRALSLQSYGPDGSAWDEMPLGLAAAQLRAIVSEYTFDGLTDPRDPRSDPRGDIRLRLEHDVRAALIAKGIRVLNVSVGIFFPKDFTPTPNLEQLDDITHQRVESWQAEWQSRIIRVRAEGEAESSRRRDIAHAQAQMDTIMKIVQALEQGPAADTDTQDEIARRFLQTLQSMADEPATRILLPGDEAAKLQLMQDIMARPRQLGTHDFTT